MRKKTVSRSYHDLNDTEKQAYRIWQSRYEGDHSTEREKAEAKREMEAMLWTGPGAIVHELKAEVRSLSARVTALEAKLATYGETTTVHKPAACGPSLTNADPLVVSTPLTREAEASVALDNDSECGTQCIESDSVEVHPRDVEDLAKDRQPKKDGRGRPRRRFIVERNVNKEWMIADREDPDNYVEGPFAKKSDATARAKEIEEAYKETQAKLDEAIDAAVDDNGPVESVTDQMFGIGDEAEVEVTEETPDGFKIPFD